jgi:hypothetical protein
MADMECKNLCIVADTSVCAPDCFKLKIGISVTGSSGALGATGEVGANRIRYLLGLCSSIVTFTDVCCFNGMDNIVLAMPLSFVQDCYKYSFVDVLLGDQLIPTVIDTTTPNLNPGDVPSVISIQKANGYLYIVIGQDRFDIATTVDEDGNRHCTVSIEFTLFNFPMTRKINLCNCSTLCKPIVWYFGDSAVAQQPIP